MLLYDDNVSSITIRNIYDDIKELCIYNQADMSRCDDIESMLNDGYRLVIYCCGVDNFIMKNFSRSDYINVFIPQDNSLLPYYLNNNWEIIRSDDYIVRLDNMDTSAMGSIYFNKAFNSLRNLMTMSSSKVSIEFSPEINNMFILQEMDRLQDSKMKFVDVDILKCCGVHYDQLPLVDYILLSALLTLVQGIKSRSLSLVDVYKSAGDDYSMIDRFYAMYNNESLIGLINLNFYYISNMLERTRDKLLDMVSVCCECSESTIDDIIDKIRQYSKQDNGVIGYLYLYNLFTI